MIRGPKRTEGTHGNIEALVVPSPAFQGASCPLLSVTAPTHGLLTGTGQDRGHAGSKGEKGEEEGGRKTHARRRGGSPCPSPQAKEAWFS